MNTAPRDDNNVPAMLFVGGDGLTYPVGGNEVTGRLYADVPGGSGTVTSVSVVSANGLAGTVATATTTPAITLSTTITGILKGNGTAISAAGASDVDSILPTQTGNNGKYLTTNGTVSSWATVAGGGDVTKVGTPVNNQIGVWTGDGTIEGDAALTFDTATDTITLGVEAATGTITAPNAVSANTDGGALYLSSGTGLGSGEGGSVTISGAEGGATGPGGSFTLAGGPGGATSGNGGSAEFNGGNAVNGNGGSIYFLPGSGGGAGTDGSVFFYDPTSGIAANLLTSSLTTSDKTFTFPDASGIFALSDNVAAVTVANEATDTSCSILFTTAATGNLQPKTNANLTFNSNTGVLTSASSVLTTTDINGGTIDGTTIGATSATTGKFSTVETTGNIELGNASDTTLSRSAAGVLAVEGVVIPSISSTNTLTNKRITKRVGSTTSSATPTINTDNVDAYHLTAQTADITSFTTNLSGTPTDFQQLRISVTGTAARAITWGASFANGPVALPTTTVTTTRLDVLLEWDSVSSKWRCMASGSTV